MKQLSLTIKARLLKNKPYTYIFSVAIPTVFLLVFLLFSFTTPEVQNSNSNFVRSIPEISSENISSNISYTVSDVKLTGAKVKEVFISKMEQTKGLFTKHLNMSVEDSEGNLVALVLTDVKDGDIGTDLNTGIYFGNDHHKVDQNLSIDLGSVVFSNSSNLILEGKDGSSLLSRNGWIEIEKCENGLISGKFEFQLEGEETNKISKGNFENVFFL